MKNGDKLYITLVKWVVKKEESVLIDNVMVGQTMHIHVIQMSNIMEEVQNN